MKFIIVLLIIIASNSLVAEFSATKLAESFQYIYLSFSGYKDSVLVAHTAFPPLNENYFLKTTNNGKSWDTITTLNEYTENKFIISSIKLFNSKEFVIAISEKDGFATINSKILRTNDAGLTWQEIFDSDTILFLPNFGTLDNGSSVVKADKYLLVSDDKWETFTEILIPENISDTSVFIPFEGYSSSLQTSQYEPINIELFSYSGLKSEFKKGNFLYSFKYPHPYINYQILTLDTQIVSVCFKNFDINGKETNTIKHYKTINMGNDWSEFIPKDTTYTYNTLYFGISNEMLVNISYNKILYSIDKGDSWTNTTYSCSDGYPLHQVFYYCFSENNLYFASKYEIYKLSLTTGVEEVKFDNNIIVSPNPATDYIYINSDEVLSYISIYNALGICVVDYRGFSAFNTHPPTPSLSYAKIS